MGVLIENMRREGFELSMSRPQVITEEDGSVMSRLKKSPLMWTDEYTGVVVEKLTARARVSCE